MRFDLEPDPHRAHRGARDRPAGHHPARDLHLGPRGQALIHAAAGGDPRRLRRLAGRFKGMVFPGDTLELEYGRESPGVLQFAVRTPRGELAITHGVAEIDP